MTTDLLSMFEAVSDGTMGERAAMNRLTGKVKSSSGQATTRQGRKTGERVGRPRTGRADPLLARLTRWQALCDRDDLSTDETEERDKLTALLTAVRPSSRLCSDPDECLVSMPGGRRGIRIKREVIPRSVSEGYAETLAEGYTDDYRRWQDDDGDYQQAPAPLRRKVGKYERFEEREWLDYQRAREYAGRTGGVVATALPRALEHSYTPASGSLAEPTPGRFPYATRPILKDQQSHTLKSIIRLVKSGQMSPESAVDLFTRWPQ